MCDNDNEESQTPRAPDRERDLVSERLPRKIASVLRRVCL